MKAEAHPWLAGPALAHEHPVHSWGACKPPRLMQDAALPAALALKLPDNRPHDQPGCMQVAGSLLLPHSCSLARGLSSPKLLSIPNLQ